MDNQNTPVNIPNQPSISLIKWFTNVFIKWQKDQSIKDFNTIPIHSLAPTSEAIDNVIYNRALKTALESPDIFNIGITGPYGSGKSSIIKTFEKKYSTKKRKFLNISLATINQSTPNTNKIDQLKQNGEASLLIKPQKKETKLDIDQKIELSIIQQLFYHVKATRIPFSRFSRISPLNKFLRIFFSVGLIAWLLSLLIVFFPNFLKQTSWYVLDWNNNRILISIIGLIVFTIGTILILCKSLIIIKNSKLNRLNFKNGEIEIGCPAEQSILNRYLDEIIYFFEENRNYNIVVFEDLDRFNDQRLFLKLREINSLLNNSESLRNRTPKIKFIYALNDELFKGNDRTKFFDVLIPVIPIINTTNSGDKISEQLKEIDPDHTISNEFLQDIQLYIDDMRLLYNISNEYLIYKNKIGAQLDKTKMYAMIVYKNIYPSDFAALHNSRGLVFRVLKSEKTKLIEVIISKLNSEKTKIDKKIEINNNLFVSNEQELRGIYIGYLWTKFNSPQSVTIVGNNYFFHQLFEEDNFSLLKKNGITKYSPISGGVIPEKLNFEIIEKEIDDKTNYDSKLEVIKIRLNNEFEQLDKRKTEITNEISFIKRLSLNEFFSKYDIADVFSEFNESENKLLFYLLRGGYLNEDYQYYLSYFYQGSLTSEDLEFVLAVKNGKILDFGFKLNNVSNAVDRIFTKDLNIAILNIDLLDYLLEDQNKCEGFLNYFVELISNKTKRATDFLEVFIQQVKNLSLFIKFICNRWSGFWKYIEKESNFSVEKIKEFMILIIRYAELEDIKKQNTNDIFQNFITTCDDLFAIIPLDINDKTISIFDNFGILFANFKDPIINIPLFDTIYETAHFELTISNIEFVIKRKNENIEDISQRLNTQNYTTIQEFGCEEMKVWVDDTINEYFEDVFFKLSENNNESEASIIKLLNMTDNGILIENKHEIISRWKGRIENIENIKEYELWPIIFKNSKVVATWKNVSNYYSILNELDSEIISFLNDTENAESLTIYSSEEVNDFIEPKGDEFVEALILENEIELPSYEVYIKKLSYSLTSLNYKDISPEKVDILIEERTLSLTNDDFQYLKQYFPNKQISLIEKWKGDFLTMIKEFSLDSNDFLLILRSNIFDFNEKITIIDIIGPSNIPGKTDLANIILELISFQEVIDFQFEFIGLNFSVSNNQKVKLLIIIKLLKQNKIDYSNTNSLLLLLDFPFPGMFTKSKKELLIENTGLNLEFIELLLKKRYISSFKEKKNVIKVRRKLI